MRETAYAWIRRTRPNPEARLRLFCFPYAGGGTSIFHHWADLLPAEIEVCAVKFPGREDRLAEQPFTRLLPLVETLAQALRPCLALPFAFFGHSLGALIGFELCRQLRREGAPQPAHLFASGYPAPQLPRMVASIHHLADVEFVDALERLHGIPGVVRQHAELLELMLPLLRADFALCETYQYGAEAPLDCPVSVYGGLQDSEVSRNALGAWREQTRGAFALRMFPGDHLFVNSAREPLLDALTQDVVPLLSEVRDNQGV